MNTLTRDATWYKEDNTVTSPSNTEDRRMQNSLYILEHATPSPRQAKARIPLHKNYILLEAVSIFLKFIFKRSKLTCLFYTAVKVVPKFIYIITKTNEL